MMIDSHFVWLVLFCLDSGYFKVVHKPTEVRGLSVVGICFKRLESVADESSGADDDAGVGCGTLHLYGERSPGPGDGLIGVIERSEILTLRLAESILDLTVTLDDYSHRHRVGAVLGGEERDLHIGISAVFDRKILLDSDGSLISD